MTEAEMLVLARKRAGRKFGFYIHAFVFVAVILGLTAINYFTSSRPWTLFPFLGWGLGLAIHAFTVFSGLSDWKQRLVQSEIEKLKAKG